MRVQMVARWREAWRWGSVRLSLLLAGVAALEQSLPMLAAYLPAHWVSYTALAVVVARLLLVQTGKPDPIKLGGTA